MFLSGRVAGDESQTDHGDDAAQYRFPDSVALVLVWHPTTSCHSQSMTVNASTCGHTACSSVTDKNGAAPMAPGNLHWAG